ncbi:unnamed protein product [Parascedosporium putredinis]|uniref:Uncharacterized protein n=1 Tax=Parascedosporium putredinis TaxID=1442378 RepID=A0A9P1HB74_9PEZI|nr:unnamed protein product [Parascedosporium putredinis]CAI8003421.1 unnamed protein product [Parascedosporium putredinis]
MPSFTKNAELLRTRPKRLSRGPHPVVRVHSRINTGELQLGNQPQNPVRCLFELGHLKILLTSKPRRCEFKLASARVKSPRLRYLSCKQGV